MVILGSSILGILGSYGVAWFGIRINTTANSRAAFASLKGDSLKTLFIPLQAGMSIGLLLVCVELTCMISILLFIPQQLAGACFIGFAIGESLGASVLRIGGGIFTKIADIGSDLMKIVFNLPEDDPKNPGVIADCTGDNAGDSVGPTADGFETYGVTSVALIAFLALALVASPILCGKLIIWLFAIQGLMVLASLVSFYFNMAFATMRYGGKKNFNWEAPLTELVWITSIVSIIVCFVATKLLLGDFTDAGGGLGAIHLPNLWWVLSAIVACGNPAERAHHGVHENFRRSNQFAPRPRSHQCLRPRRRVAQRPVRSRGRKFFRVLDGARDRGARCSWRICSRRIPPCSALMPAQFTFAALHFCLWSRGVWFSRRWHRSRLPWTASAQ